MNIPVNQVCRKEPPGKTRVSDALAEGLARAARKHGKGALADGMDASTKTVDRALTGTLPQMHTALAALLVDPAALDEVFALYGLARPRPLHAAPANDMETVSAMSDLIASFCAALADGHRDHRETLTLAAKVRELQPALTALLQEEEAIRAA